jgi:hypothetical protein
MMAQSIRMPVRGKMKLRRTKTRLALGAARSLVQRLLLTVALRATNFTMGLWGDDVGLLGQKEGCGSWP